MGTNKSERHLAQGAVKCVIKGRSFFSFCQLADPNLFDEIGRSYGAEHAVEDFVISPGVLPLENRRRTEEVRPPEDFRG